ncbi:hypothetical protein BH10BDE1_BH10BDE1_08470 [soil metagenome]
MQQAHAITSVLLLAFFTTILPSEAISKSSDKPVEVKSDPYGVGNPTKYSILRGNSKVTFSHPLRGQFTRAEVTTREKTGTQLTRFLLSGDRRTYLPVLSFLTPFETHLSKKDDKLCIADPTSLTTLIEIAPKANDGEIIAKKRDELVKANFFDMSCFDTSIPIEHRNAIMNAAADVLSTKTQDITPEPKYLRCLEKFGYAHESGTIQALEKVSKNSPKEICKLRLACTADDDAEQGQFEEKKCLITIKTSALAEREPYARLLFHELSHSVPMRDGVPLELLEECCAAGKKCEVLKAFAEKNRTGEKATTIAESLSQKNTVVTSMATIFEGTAAEAAPFAKSSEAVVAASRVSMSSAHPTLACAAVGKDICAKETSALYSILYGEIGACFETVDAAVRAKEHMYSQLLIATLILQARADSTQCGTGGTGSVSSTIKREMSDERPRTQVEAIAKLDQTSPINWEIPKEPTAIRMASTLPSDDPPQSGQGSSIGHTPTRTIASIEPLPDEAPQRTLGSSSNRRDVGAGRATVLVDTVERAARKVTQTLTPEKIELLQVDRKEIFDANYKPKTKSPQYFVTSSATKPIQVADIGDIQGLSFPNPFASSLPKDKIEAKLAKVGGTTSTKTKTANAKTNTLNEKDGDSKDDGAGLTASALRGSRATTNANALAGMNENREPNGTAKTTHDFKSMDRSSLVKFLTSGFRVVSPELENPGFAQALIDNRIQIHDHENRQIGSMKPDTTFIYSSELGRLVQTRANREKK